MRRGIIATGYVNLVSTCANLVIAIAATAILARSMLRDDFAFLGTAGAIISLVALVCELGAAAAVSRYLADTRLRDARGSYLKVMFKRRTRSLVVMVGVMWVVLAGYCHLVLPPGGGSAWAISGLLSGSAGAYLMAALGYAALFALFDHLRVNLIRLVVLVVRTSGLIIAVKLGGGPERIAWIFLGASVLEAILACGLVWQRVRRLRGNIPPEVLVEGRVVSTLSILEKIAASLGASNAMVVVLMLIYSAYELAIVVAATELVMRMLAAMSLPFGNMVAPYLNSGDERPEARVQAAVNILVLTLLVFSFASGFTAAAAPWLVRLLLGNDYVVATGFVAFLAVMFSLESWMRFSLSPAMIRNGLYRGIAVVSIVQIATALTAYGWCWYARPPLWLAVVAVAGSRGVMSLLYLGFASSLLPRAVWLKLGSLLAIAITAAVCSRSLANASGSFHGGAVLATVAYVFVFGLGLRWAIGRVPEVALVIRRLFPVMLMRPALQRALGL